MNTSSIRSARGFTLIELMVTVAVMAILAGLAVPSFQGLLRSSRLAGESNDILAALSLARSESVRRNQRVVFCRAPVVGGVIADNSACITGDTASRWAGWMVFLDSNANGARDAANEPLLRSGVFSRDTLITVASTNLQGGGNRLVFRPDGIARDAGSNAIQQVALRVCEASGSGENARDVVVAFGSRINVVRASSAACAAPPNP